MVLMQTVKIDRQKCKLHISIEGNQEQTLSKRTVKPKKVWCYRLKCSKIKAKMSKQKDSRPGEAVIQKEK